MHLVDEDLPSICLIIPAISEFDVIKRKIENTLQLYYPENKLLILAISDKNNDQAQAFLAEYKKQGVINFRKRGLNNYYQALNIGAKLAKADIVIFSDIRNDFNDMALVKLARHFKDPDVGAVTGIRSMYESKSIQSSSSDSLYWRYEAIIKHAESKLGSVTSAIGEILAIRKELYQPVPENTINFDTAITFNIVKSGHRVLVDKNAVSFRDSKQDIKDLFKEQTLKTKGGFQTLYREFSFLFPPRTWFAFNFISHKVIRWLIPFMLIALYVIPIFQFENAFLKIFFILENLFYLLALAGWFFRKKEMLSGATNIITYFSVMNLAVLVGFFKFLFRR